jgi:hypothetical protein
MLRRFIFLAALAFSGLASAQVTLLTSYTGSLTGPEQTKVNAIIGQRGVISYGVYNVTANALYQTMLDIPIDGTLRRYTGSSGTVNGVLVWQTSATAPDFAIITQVGTALSGLIRYDGKAYVIGSIGTRVVLSKREQNQPLSEGAAGDQP